MNDVFDFYIGRSLKNWAARQQPPVGERERLLKKAAAGAQSYHDSVTEFGGRLSEPFTQSRAWSFHLATTRLQVA